MKSYLRQAASALRTAGSASRSVAISAQRQFGAAAAPGSVGGESFRVSAFAGAAIVSFAATSMITPSSGVIMAAPAAAVPGSGSVWKKGAVGEMPRRTDVASDDDDDDDEEEEEEEEGEEETAQTVEAEQETEIETATEATPKVQEKVEAEPTVVVVDAVEESEEKEVAPAVEETSATLAAEETPAEVPSAEAVGDTKDEAAQAEGKLEEPAAVVAVEEKQEAAATPAAAAPAPAEDNEEAEASTAGATAAAAAAAAAATATSTAAADTPTPVEAKNEEDPRYDGYVAIFLDAESQAKLREMFPPRHATRGADRVLLLAKPNSEEYNAVSDTFAKEVELSALVYVETDAAQVYVVPMLALLCVQLESSPTHAASGSSSTLTTRAFARSSTRRRCHT